MFRPIDPDPSNITIYIDGSPCPAREGDSVATILLKEGHAALHSAPNGTPRGPYCMMGVCFDCMITLEDGRVEQACQIYARDGMRVYLPLASRDRAG